jgi:hypothetical protein
LVGAGRESRGVRPARLIHGWSIASCREVFSSAEQAQLQFTAARMNAHESTVLMDST